MKPTPSSPSPESVEKEVKKLHEDECDCEECRERQRKHAELRAELNAVLGKKDAVSATTVQEKETLEKPGAAIEPRTVQGPMELSVDALGEREETRRWLLVIGLELGVPIQVAGDENGEPHEAWRGLYKRILEHLTSSPKATESADVTTDLGDKETAGRNAHVRQMALNWNPTSERLPEVCKPVIGYADRWVDEDYNEMGMRECFRNDDEWQSAAWNNTHDCWDVEVGAPDYWMAFPAAPIGEAL